MGKVTQVNNGDSGLTARTQWNEALKSVAISDLDDGTAGEVITWDNTGVADTVAAGTGNYVLTANGVGQKPSFQDPASNPLIAGGIPSVKSYTFKSKASNGIEYIAGYYEAPAADANLTQASTTQTYGAANIGYGAHAFVVMAAAGATDGSDLVLTVTGTSITDGGVRTPADSEVVIADGTAVATDEYYETSKKWIGQITYTLSSTGGTAFNLDFNYGLSKYDDIGNVSFQITGVEFVGEASANDSGFNITVLIHDGTGWTYSAAAFTPGGTVLVDMQTDYNTEYQLSNNEYFSYKRTNLATLLDGTASEGFVFKITTTANNAVDYMDGHMKFLYTDSIIT